MKMFCLVMPFKCLDMHGSMLHYLGSNTSAKTSQEERQSPNLRGAEIRYQIICEYIQSILYYVLIS